MQCYRYLLLRLESLSHLLKAMVSVKQCYGQWSSCARPVFLLSYASWHFLTSFGCLQFAHRILWPPKSTTHGRWKFSGHRIIASIEPSISFMESYGSTDVYGRYGYRFTALRLRLWASSGEPLNHAPLGITLWFSFVGSLELQNRAMDGIMGFMS